jgi:hypothetical protein
MEGSEEEKVQKINKLYFVNEAMCLAQQKNEGCCNTGVWPCLSSRCSRILKCAFGAVVWWELCADKAWPRCSTSLICARTPCCVYSQTAHLHFSQDPAVVNT